MSERLNPRLLEVIACPRCLARLQYDAENQRLICRYEHIDYPIENGVPILVSDRAERINDSSK